MVDAVFDKARETLWKKALVGGGEPARDWRKFAVEVSCAECERLYVDRTGPTMDDEYLRGRISRPLIGRRSADWYWGYGRCFPCQEKSNRLINIFLFDEEYGLLLWKGTHLL